MMLFTTNQIEKIKDVLNNGGNVAFKILQFPTSKSTYGIYGESFNTAIVLNKIVSYNVDKLEIVIYKSITEYIFECYLLRKTQGKSYNCNYCDCIFTTLEFELFDSNGDHINYENYVVDVDFYKL